jgi:hypothetical protein
MSMTITLDTNLANSLTKQAASQNMNVEQFVLDTLRIVAEFSNTNGHSAEAESIGNNESGLTTKDDKKPVPQVRRSTRGSVSLDKEQQWIRQHKEEYRGQWVVLDGDRLVGHAATAKAVTAFVEQARAEGSRSPFVKLIPLDDEPIWMMWL